MIRMELIKENKKLLKRLSDTKLINMNVADALLFVYQNELHPYKNEIQRIIETRKVNEIQALYLWLTNRLEIDLNDYDSLKISNRYFLANIHKQKLEKYTENPYVKAISNVNINEKNYSLKTLAYKPYQLFPLDDLIIDEKDYFSEYTPIGFFDKKYNYLALLENKRIWMSLNPNEINTMAPHIDRASGNILVLGLGLGYFPFMCSLKDEVKTITIIERDQNIINLFQKYLLDKFPYKNKNKIIRDDAILYLEENHDYDYIFADLWHDSIDGLQAYLKLKNIQEKHHLNMSYWLENSFSAYLRRIAISILNKEDDNFVEESFYKEIYLKLKEAINSSNKDLLTLLSEKELLQMALK